MRVVVSACWWPPLPSSFVIHHIVCCAPVACRLLCIYVSGYTIGDDDAGKEQKQHTTTTTTTAALLRREDVQLTLVRVRGAVGAPAWIWNHLAWIAREEGADYVYQVRNQRGVQDAGAERCWCAGGAGADRC